MEKGTGHLVVIVGAADTAGRLQSVLSTSGVGAVQVHSRVQPLREQLVVGENEFVVVCCSLDESMMTSESDDLAVMLEDHQCFASEIRSVGILTELGLTPEAAEMGCDVYVERSAQVAQVIRLLQEKWVADGSDDGRFVPLAGDGRSGPVEIEPKSIGPNSESDNQSGELRLGPRRWI